MSAMKPDGWMAQENAPRIIAAHTFPCLPSASKVNYNVPLYTLATVRKWLEEEPSERVVYAGAHLSGTKCYSNDEVRNIWKDMLAAKLEELS